METKEKLLRRNAPDYKEVKIHKLGYKHAMRNLFLNQPNWKKLARAMGIRNVPTDIDDRLSIQADVKRLIKTN